MRPIKLILSAFGPYIHEIIDMNSLGEKGIYLITGDTGAGKTTIFDAITYALYGEASGSIRESNMFRCKYADIQTPTYVELVFEYKGELYTIKRNPEYERLAKKGTGTTIEKKNSELHLPNNKIITKSSEVDETIESIMGITCAQFTQIAMIAQGEFQKLLHASTEERSAIFQKIFQTKNYQRLQYKLKDDTRILGDEYSELQRGIQQYLDSIVGCDALEGTTSAKIELIQKQLEYDSIQRDKLDTIINQLVQEQQEIQLQLERGEEKKTKQKEHHEKIRKQQDLLAELESLRTIYLEERAKEPLRIECNNRVIILKEEFKKYGELTALETSQNKNINEQNIIKQELADLNIRIQELLTQKEQLILEQRQLSTAGTNFKVMQEHLYQWTSLQENHSKLLNTSSTLIDKLNKKIAEQQLLNTTLEKNKKKLSEYNHTADSLKESPVQKEQLHQEISSIRNTLDLCDLLCEKIKELKSINSKLAESQQTYKTSSENATMLNAKYQSQFQLYMDAQAGIFAQNLQEGVPCPVCGSTHHPSHAQLTSEPPTKDVLDQMLADSELASTKASEDMTVANSFLTTGEILKQQIMNDWYEIPCKNSSNNKDIDEISTLLNTYQQELLTTFNSLNKQFLQADSNVKKLKNIEQLLPTLEQAVIDTQDASTNCSMELLQLKGEINTCIHQANDEVQKLSAITPNITNIEITNENLLQNLNLNTEEITQHTDSLSKEINQLNTQLVRAKSIEDELLPNLENSHKELSEALATKTIQQTTIITRLATINEQIDSLIGQLGTKTHEEALQQIADSEAMSVAMKTAYDTADENYNQASQQYALLQGQLENLKELLMSLPDVSVEDLTQKSEELKVTIKFTQETMQSLISQIDSNTRNLDSIQLKSKELLRVESNYQWMKALSDTANGTLTKKERIMLETYIQMGYFDRVTRRANIRLMKMTAGQFELKRREDVGNSSGKKGLDLDVIDHYNGSIRSAKTLSGGESFKASLALALGLADEIQSSAGGIKLDTMFVDEGFGSLDAESLQQAIKILMELGDGSRLVGIISHVDELKEKIDKQLIINKNGTDGSHHMIRL